MNSRYLRKALIKLLNLTNSVYNSPIMAVKLKKMISNLLTEETKHVGRWSRGYISHVRQGSIRGMLSTWAHQLAQVTLTHEYISTQSMLSREVHNHSSTLALEHKSTKITLAHEHVSTKDTLTREHAFSTRGTQFSRLH